MLKELLNKIEEELKAQLPTVKVGRYKGEFEEGTDWSPVFPVIFFRLNDYVPTNKSTGGKVLSADTGITLYVADKDINSSKGLDTIEDAIGCFDGVVFKFLSNNATVTVNVSIHDEGFKLYGYIKGVEVYTLQILVD